MWQVRPNGLLSGTGKSISVKVLLTPRDSLVHIKGSEWGTGCYSSLLPCSIYPPFSANIIMQSGAQCVLKGKQPQRSLIINCYYSQPLSPCHNGMYKAVGVQTLKLWKCFVINIFHFTHNKLFFMLLQAMLGPVLTQSQMISDQIYHQRLLGRDEKVNFFHFWYNIHIRALSTTRNQNIESKKCTLLFPS